MKKSITSFSLFFCFSFFPFFSEAQVTASDEDPVPYTTCNSDGANATRTSNDLTNPVNVGTIDDRSCYANYKEIIISGTTWGIYNIADGSNNQDTANTLQPRIERSLSRSQTTGVGSFAKFNATVRILEVGDTTGTGNDGTYIMQAKGRHTGGGGPNDPAICLYLAKPVLDSNGNQVSFNIYREQINYRGGSGADGRDFVFLKNIAKNVATTIELKVGFREDPADSTKKIHYADAIIGGTEFKWNIPEPERGTQSGIRYGAYRVKGGRAQIRWANTTYQKVEIEDTNSGNTTNNTITAAATGDWNVGTIWVGGVVPTGNDNVVITDVTVTVNSGQSAVCNNLTLDGTENSRVIQVREGASLQINGDLITNRSQDGIRLSYSSATTTNRDTGTIIINGVTKTPSDGENESSNRRALVAKILPTNNDWHLVSVGGTNSRQNELARTATTSNNYNTVTNAAGTHFSIGAYNGTNTSGSKYEYIPVPSSPYANGVTFSKTGYAVKVNNTATPSRPEIRLRPVVQYADASEDISDAGDGFNLVGNPFFAYLHANTAADGTNNLLSINSGVLEEQTIWMWNNAKSGGAGFEVFNLGSAALRIQPFQAFFVKAKPGGGTEQSFSVTKAMRSHTKAGEFLKSQTNRFEIDLSISNGENTNKTAVRFIDNTTTSFDNGYDSSVFGGYSSELEVYTSLLDDTNKKLAIQSLPNSDFEKMIIPVGVTTKANSEITFSAEVLNIAKGYDVVLEDRLNNVFTSLTDENSEYTTTVTAVNTDGRFFLHVTSSVLSANDKFLSSVSLFTTDNNNVRILGLQHGNAKFQLFSILGEQVLSTSFKSKSVNNISLPSLSSGVYIVHLTTESGKLNKKIVLE